jgi:EF-P beta-lysylation protein EpmB
VARMRVGDPLDPLLLQILPTKQELLAMPGYSADPLQEQQVNKLPGLIHKYRGRVLLTVTAACAVNCRYCFRQNFAYDDNNPGRVGWQKIVDYVAADPSINEIIFSGGDPLIAKDNLLAQIIKPFAALPQIKRLRIHTRLPIVIPQRITQELTSMLMRTGLQVIIVVHANHPNEIDESVRQSLQFLRDAGITVLNQAVLLKGINDDPIILAELSEKLFTGGCLPYYLHTLDKVFGSAHFDVDLKQAQDIMWKLSQILPGFLVPKLVTEVPGVSSKVPVDLEIDY